MTASHLHAIQPYDSSPTVFTIYKYMVRAFCQFQAIQLRERMH